MQKSLPIQRKTKKKFSKMPSRSSKIKYITADNGHLQRRTRTTTPNSGFKEMAADEQTESSVHLIYFCNGGQ